MEFSEGEAVSVTAFYIVSAAGYQDEGKRFIVFDEGKAIIWGFIAQFLLPAVLFSFPALSF